MIWILALLTSFYLTAQVTTSAALITTSGTAIFPIDPTQRGNDIAQMVQTLNNPPFSGGFTSVSLQLRNNTLIQNVTSIKKSTHSTILIVTYKIGTTANYIPLLVEQIVDVIYNNQGVFGPFTPHLVSGVLPYFSMDEAKRTEDLKETVRILLNDQPYSAGNPTVNIQLSLSGSPFAGMPPSQNGIIPSVRSITIDKATNKTLMIINYKPANQTEHFVAAPEQVINILYNQPNSPIQLQ